MRSGVVAFARFWYHFIVGDDWVIAATVVVIAVLGLSLRRARTTTR